jgi:polygalacturonase
MDSHPRREFLKLAGFGAAGAAAAIAPRMTVPAHAQQTPTRAAGIFDVRASGAKGDGVTVDTPAINRAIAAAETAGGGTVRFPAGNYLCYSIHLKSNVALFLDQGAVIIAADPLPEGQSGGYDDPEPKQPWEAYQDFGHNHWHNSLIWGENLHDISIYGPGRIWGRGLVRSNSPDSHNPRDNRIRGVGNKSIALKNCRNVTLRDFQILKGGWFGILATGVDNLLIDGLTIDTNRDGMDIDCCKNVRIVNCAVNSPWDDAIVPKSSYALGHIKPTENLEISNCYVTGWYEDGTLLDGTWKPFDESRRVPHTGRIKCGTESNGGFKNLTISNCVFDRCQGLALETVDGALLEDVTITNISMRGIVSSPIYMRLGRRLRGPAGIKPGTLQRVAVSNLVCSDSASQFGCIISGIPGYAIRDIKLRDIYIQHRGGGTKEDAAIVPPENATGYPGPKRFGPMPSQGFFLRHVNNIELSGVEIAAMAEDARPAFVLQNVNGADFFHVKTPPSSPVIVTRDSKDVETRWVRGVNDGKVA